MPCIVFIFCYLLGQVNASGLCPMYFHAWYSWIQSPFPLLLLHELLKSVGHSIWEMLGAPELLLGCTLVNNMVLIILVETNPPTCQPWVIDLLFCTRKDLLYLRIYFKSRGLRWFCFAFMSKDIGSGRAGAVKASSCMTSWEQSQLPQHHASRVQGE